MSLKDWGWNQFFSSHFEAYRKQELIPARVAEEHRERYLLFSEMGDLSAEIPGRWLHSARSRDELPAVGDWVAARPVGGEAKAIIQAILPRQSRFERKVAGRTTELQVLAANVDVAFIVSGLDDEFNLRRLERYLTMVWESGAAPVILLNKADLRTDLDVCIAQVEEVAMAVPVHTVSAAQGHGLEVIRQYLGPGKSGVFIGSSGVGKSTLINGLLGESLLETAEVSDYMSRGRHTTSSRQLIMLPGGGLVIDTPGMRELQLWSDPAALAGSFADVEALARQCHFRDCRHGQEPGCAVRQAIQQGELAPERLESFLKLQKELAFLARRQDINLQRQENARWKRIMKSAKRNDKRRF